LKIALWAYISTYFTRTGRSFIGERFIKYETPLLVQSMVAISLWMSGEEQEKSKAIDLHNVLGKAIRQQAVCPADSSHHIQINSLTNNA
jgi:hypothetical protein